MENNEAPRPLWSLVSAKYGSPELTKLLEDGYEPWQMYTDRAPGCRNLDVIIILRKLTVRSAKCAQTPPGTGEAIVQNNRICVAPDCFELVYDQDNPDAAYCIGHVCMAGGCTNYTSSFYGYCIEHAAR